MNADLLFWGSLVFTWVVYLWDQYLGWRQYRKYVTTSLRPPAVESIMDKESFDKSRVYKIDKARFGFFTSAWSQLETTLILLLGAIPWLWSCSATCVRLLGYQHEILISVVFISMATVIETATSLPFSVYDTFVIEQRHGFNKQTAAFFAKDRLKSLAVTLALEAPILAAVVWVVQLGGDYFFVYVWLLLSAVIFVLMTVYPEFIAPLFDKYTPLPDGALKESIEALAAKLAFPLKKLYVVEGSKRSAHSNAYLYGLFNNKRIVLYDTLLQDYTPVERGDDTPHEKRTERAKLGTSNEEVVAIIGHELGHWQLNHVVHGIVVSELNLLFMLSVFGYFARNRSVYEAFGFYDEQPVVVGLLIVFQFIFAPYNEVLSFFMTAWTRAKEFAADRFSAELGYAPLLSSGLVKLAKDNLSFPVDDWLYSMWTHSHPPLIERLAALSKTE